MNAIIDLDDLYDESQLDEVLYLHSLRPDILLTIYCIPAKLGPVHDLKIRYPWIIFAQHGREHTPFECVEWTADKAKMMIQRNLDDGYERIFRPPNWRCDRELEIACHDLDIVLAHHPTDYKPTIPRLHCWPGLKGVPPEIKFIHSHITPNPVTDDINTCGDFRSKSLLSVGEFLNPITEAVVIPFPH